MNKLTQARLKELLRYDPETGEFVWLESRGKIKAGQKAGTVKGGYAVVRIQYVQFYMHRLAWLYVKGVWPSHEIDHENGKRSDNRFNNLRDVTSGENKKNMATRSDNVSGVSGVSWLPHRSKWRVRISHNKKEIHLGMFAKKEDAIAARKTAEKQHGFHENHGR